MPNVVLYTSGLCPYCSRAKQLLEDGGIDYEEIRVDKQRGMRAEMERRSGGTSVPQIFIDDRHVGGHDDLAALQARGELDTLLNIGEDAR